MGNSTLKTGSSLMCCTSQTTNHQTQIICQQLLIQQQESLPQTLQPSCDHPPILQKQISQYQQSLANSLMNQLKFQNPQALVDQSCLLELLILNSSTLTPGQKLEINAQGLLNGHRQVKDGYTYFGCKKKNKTQTVNDFVIPLVDKQVQQTHRGQHFMIFYDIPTDSYYIKDLALGFGTFVKIKQNLVLKDNHLLHIGDNFILVNIEKGFPRLRLKLFGSLYTGQIFYYDPEEINILIGRANYCDIQINDSQTSKIQGNIRYSRVKGWVLCDGDQNLGRPSTNGTWLYLNQDFQLYSGMVFKSNHTLFLVNLLSAN